MHDLCIANDRSALFCNCGPFMESKRRMATAERFAVSVCGVSAPHHYEVS